MEAAHSASSARARASTLQIGSTLDSSKSREMHIQRVEDLNGQNGDIFDKDSSIALDASNDSPTAKEMPRDAPVGFDDLPIELLSLTDRFIESLTAKVYSEPPTINRLSNMFQDFYTKAESHIATHISALSTKTRREASPTPSTSLNRSGNRLKSTSSKDTVESAVSAPEQQMLTPQEISDRRKTRRLLEQKRVALEEAVERRTCETVYKRIWRHRSTLDEVRDEKLRSRTAALALVGIGLKDLGIDIDSTQLEGGAAEESLESRIEDWIAPARESLLRMNEAKYPLGKLQHLAAAHKCIVEVLSRLHQSSSSADEILPTLIYTLISSRPEGVNAISNLNFTQRFRASNKVDGEAAYCLTNFEAAITFLETVDLATLRSDEPLEGPPKSSSRPSTPHGEGGNDWAAGPPLSSPKSLPAAVHIRSSPPQPLFSDPLQSPSIDDDILSHSTHRRRRSDLFQPATTALGAASDAVRTTADSGLKNIGSTLDHSFKFLFGRLKEQNVETNGTVVVPKTLDDARKLVDPRPLEEDQSNNSGASSIAEKSDDHADGTPTFDDKLLGVFAGRKQQQQPRDRSADSLQSSGSGGKKVAFANDSKAKTELTSQLSSSPSNEDQVTSAPNSAVESMRNLGNSLNPLNRFAGMSVMRGFGRNSSGTTPTLATAATTAEKLPAAMTGMAEAKTSATPRSLPPHKVAPPIRRFMDVADAGDLKVGEVTELLRDYQRLAAALRTEGKIPE
ncbi:MAG: hypothetical protein LQ344_000911 [Seirophora lacunosa]|nr:MAG: hypothetical protein LQ344_000911 [Seirophora lacunosa]